jgi:hypothetical protein
MIIALTIGQLRRLATTTAPPRLDPATSLRWSRWRRRHQATARRSHYRGRDTATSP